MKLRVVWWHTNFISIYIFLGIYFNAQHDFTSARDKLKDFDERIDAAPHFQQPITLPLLARYSAASMAKREKIVKNWRLARKTK